MPNVAVDPPRRGLRQRRPERLGGILDQREAVPLGNLCKGIELADVAIEVDER